MNSLRLMTSNDFEKITVAINEPFAEFLLGDQDEHQFNISLLDVVRFAGHACPAMIGAFLISKKAIKELFPDTNVCIRGQVAIEIPTPVAQGATGPISNVFSMIFGAWDQSGFGGLQGQFIRRGLLKYDAANVEPGTFRFHNLNSKRSIDVSYNPSKVQIPDEVVGLPFQNIWRYKITAILKNPDDYLSARFIN